MTHPDSPTPHSITLARKLIGQGQVGALTPSELEWIEYIGTLERRLSAAEADARRLREACEAAIAYDAAIHRKGFMGDVENYAGEREHYATGDDLDALYEDWVGKARAALGK
jgi:hypothetical protein